MASHQLPQVVASHQCPVAQHSTVQYKRAKGESSMQCSLSLSLSLCWLHVLAFSYVPGESVSLSATPGSSMATSDSTATAPTMPADTGHRRAASDAACCSTAAPPLLEGTAAAAVVAPPLLPFVLVLAPDDELIAACKKLMVWQKHDVRDVWNVCSIKVSDVFKQSDLGRR